METDKLSQVEGDLRKLKRRQAYYDLGLKYLEEHPHEADVIVRGLARTAGSLLIQLGKSLRTFS